MIERTYEEMKQDALATESNEMLLDAVIKAEYDLKKGVLRGSSEDILVELEAKLLAFIKLYRSRQRSARGAIEGE